MYLEQIEITNRNNESLSLESLQKLCRILATMLWLGKSLSSQAIVA